MSWNFPNEQIEESFRHPAGTTGVTDANWTKNVFQGRNQRTDIAISVTEIGGGYYYVTFTPDVPGQWFIYVFPTASAANFKELRYQVYDIVSELGGEGFDSEKHSLSRIRAVLKIIRDEQSVLVGPQREVAKRTDG